MKLERTWEKASLNTICVATPNDPKLSDGGPEAGAVSTAAQGEGAGCAGASWRAAQPVTEPVGLQPTPLTETDMTAVRCSAWLGAWSNVVLPVSATEKALNLANDFVLDLFLGALRLWGVAATVATIDSGLPAGTIILAKSPISLHVAACLGTKGDKAMKRAATVVAPTPQHTEKLELCELVPLRLCRLGRGAELSNDSEDAPDPAKREGKQKPTGDAVVGYKPSPTGTEQAANPTECWWNPLPPDVKKHGEDKTARNSDEYLCGRFFIGGHSV